MAIEEKEPKRPTSPVSMTSPGGGAESKIEQPKPGEFKGKWRNKKDGFIYKHAKKDHPHERTHKFIVEPVYHETEKDEAGNPKLIHSGLFWEGTKDEAEAAFERL